MVLAVACLAFVAVPAMAHAAGRVSVASVTTDAETNPLGLGSQSPHLGWVLAASVRDESQSAYQVLVASSPDVLAVDHGDVWNSGVVASSDSVNVQYGGAALQSGARYYWKVRVWDQSGQVSDWSAPAHWQMGLLSASDWGNAQWVGVANPSSSQPQPAPYLRDDFQVDKPVAHATLYVTALGFYQAYINGAEVSPDKFEPGLTNFPSTTGEEPSWALQTVEYQEYDVTGLLQQGANALGSILACGFYCGYIPAPVGYYDLFGTQPWLLAHLVITYTDGTTADVDSGPSWVSHSSMITSTDLYMGEDDDARAAVPNWDSPATSDAGWAPVTVDDSVIGNASLTPRAAPAVQVTGVIHPVSMTEPSPGVYVFNLGQNIAGWAQLTAQGPAGTTVTLTFGEQLNPDGTVYNANYRLAQSTDEFTLAGTGGPETFQPYFTSHGFQYVEVTGYPGTPTLASIEGIVAHTPLPTTGSLTTSSPLINQLESNIVWSQENTTFDFPTDCPQRDERLPWVSADVQEFAPTGMINANEDAYLNNWLNTIFGSQHPDGSFGNIAPDFWPGNPDGSAGWVDTPLILVYELWQNYGDVSVISKFWPGLSRFMAWEESAAGSNYMSGVGSIGDWLSPDAPPGPAPGDTPDNVVAEAFFGYDSELMSEMATAMGDSRDAATYSALFEHVKAAFDQAYVEANGLMYNDVGTDPTGVQTEYVMALYMNLLPADLVSAAGNRLAALIQENGDHLDTGFLGTDHLLNVLTATGHSDVAYSLLTQTTYPSWGYEIARGATTIWERWDGVLPSGGFQDPSENSFDHPAEGGAGNWLYTELAGIQAEDPGYGQIRIDPYMPAGLTHAAGSIDTVRGLVSSSWTQEEDGTTALDVTIPVNSTGTVVVPAGAAYQITEGGTPITQVPGISVVTTGTEGVTLAVGSGSYAFVSDPNAQPSGPTTSLTTIPWTGPATQTGTSGPPSRAPEPARPTPRGLRVRARLSSSNGHGPYRLIVTGRLLLPAGVSAGKACEGRITLLIRTAGRAVLDVPVGLTRACGFTRGVLFSGRSWDRRHGTFSITVAFGGDMALGPIKRRGTTTVKYG